MRTAQVGPGRGAGRRTTTRATRGAGALALLALVLAGCGAAPGGGDASVGEAGAMSMAGAAADDAGGAAAPDEAAVSDTAGGTADADATGAAAAGRQVVTSGDVGLVSADPRAAADAVVDLVERAGGRVDARQETAARESEGVLGTASLTVRVPSDALTGVLDGLEDVGEVDTVDLRSEDVTATAQDLDARIRATRLSVARIEDLLSRATTQTDIISAENTLTERQATLEQLESQRARVAEQVALSTLRVQIWAATPPAEVAAEPRGGFLGGLESGWAALVSVAGVVVLVIGALLPWAVVAALLLGVVLLLRRAVRRRRAATAGASGGPGAPGAPGGTGQPGDGRPGDEGPAASDPGDRETVGAGSPRG